jgi:hypothetical protein
MVGAEAAVFNQPWDNWWTATLMVILAPVAVVLGIMFVEATSRRRRK